MFSQNFVNENLCENSVNRAIYTKLTFHNNVFPWPNSGGPDLSTPVVDAPMTLCGLDMPTASNHCVVFVIGRSQVRPPIYALPRNNLGHVVYMHVPLSTKQYKLVPASAGT